MATNMVHWQPDTHILLLAPFGGVIFFPLEQLKNIMVILWLVIIH